MKDLLSPTKNQSVYHDLQSLNRLRESSADSPRETLKAAVKEFESYFLNLVFKNMRSANKVIGEESPLNNDKIDFANDMYDQQLALELSQSSQFGIGDLLFKQLERSLPQQNSIGSTSSAVTGTLEEHLALINKSAGSKIGSRDNYIPVANKQNPVSSPLVDYLQTRVASVFNPELIQSSSQAKEIETSKSPGQNIGGVDKAKENTLSNINFKVSQFESKEAFIQKLKPLAKKAANILGVHPGILVAQAALETGWGQYFGTTEKGQASNNLFGIKTNNQWTGDTSTAQTLEFIDGIPEKLNQTFKAYHSIEQSFSDYVELIKNSPRYQHALDLASEPKAYLQGIQSGGYATDPNYAEKIFSIFQRENLDLISD